MKTGHVIWFMSPRYPRQMDWYQYFAEVIVRGYRGDMNQLVICLVYVTHIQDIM